MGDVAVIPVPNDVPEVGLRLQRSAEPCQQHAVARFRLQRAEYPSGPAADS